MIHVYSDLITVYCDSCASTIKLYSSGLTEPLHDAIRGCGWEVDTKSTVDYDCHIPTVRDLYDKHTCRACVRKEQGKGRRD